MRGSIKYILLASLLLLFVFVAIMSIFFQTKETTKTPFPTPTLVPQGSWTTTSNSFVITDISPKKDLLQTLSSASPISITFNQPLDPQSLDFTIIPQRDMNVLLNENHTELTFKPTSFWIANTPYKIVIQKVQNEDKTQTISNVSIEFQAVVYIDQ